MATNLTWAINHSNTDTSYVSSGSIWVNIDPSNDSLVPSAGSATVADGLTIPSQSAINQAGVVLTGIQQIVPYYFLADASANQLKKIFLMGNTTNQYVMAFSFNGSTASEPVLQLWDDATLTTVVGTTLGAGTPSNSWWRAICTTSGGGAANWTGIPLAGSSSGNYLNLNNGFGALSAAGVLYCNIKIVVPASATTGTNATPKLAVKYASN